MVFTENMSSPLSLGQEGPPKHKVANSPFWFQKKDLLVYGATPSDEMWTGKKISGGAGNKLSKFALLLLLIRK